MLCVRLRRLSSTLLALDSLLSSLRGGMCIASDGSIHIFLETVDPTVLDRHDVYKLGRILFARGSDPPLKISQNNDFLTLRDKFCRFMDQIFLGFSETFKKVYDAFNSVEFSGIRYVFHFRQFPRNIVRKLFQKRFVAAFEKFISSGY